MVRKQDIRKEFLKKRNSLSEEKVEKYSKLITDKVLALKQYREADEILIYASYQKEVSTYEIMTEALQAGKTVYCPKVLGAGIMEFYQIASLEEIVPGYKNIPEPQILTHPYETSNLAKAFMIMPLVAFDTQNNRLGYGGGFYDRYLQRFPLIKRIALGFECQKYLPGLPAEETDQKPEIIITELTTI